MDLGAPGPWNDPVLTVQDMDGAGPEALEHAAPNEGAYRVAVHYWNDHDLGPSLATVRVYIDSNLVFEAEGVELVHGDMWEVADIAWPSGVVTAPVASDGGLAITPLYPSCPGGPICG